MVNNALKLVIDNPRPWNADMWNHAYIYGEASKEFDALMDRPAPLIERDWGTKPVPQRGWRTKPKTWGERLDDSLTWHREDTSKEGAGYVFGASASGERKAENMRGMVAIGLDVEPEQSLDDVIDLCERSGLAIVLYTSHNFDRTTDSAPVDSVLKHGDEVSTDAVRAHLRSKNAYSEDFVSRCEMTDPRADIDGKIECVWSCPPLQKMRVVVLFDEPVDITTLDPSPKKGQEIWAKKVRGIADVLGVRIDPVATDPSRILYIAKHRPGADYHCAVFRGRPVQWDEIPEVAKGHDNPFRMVGLDVGSATIPEVTTSNGIDVTALYRSFGKRWLLADMLDGTKADKSEGSDKRHVVCPFSDDHTSESGPTSTSVWNAPDTEHGFAKVLCQHTCKERYHTVDYVARWIEDGILDPAMLEDPAWMIGAPDQPGLFEELTPEELSEQQEEAAEQARSFEEQAEEFDQTAPWSEIEKFCTRIHKEGADKTAQVNVAAIIAKNTNHTRHDVKALWKELNRVQGAARDERTGGILTTDPAPDQTQYAADAAKAANDKSPYLFEYMESPAIVRRGRIKVLNRAARRHELGKVTVFQRPQGDSSVQHIYPPYDVVDDLFSSDLSEFCLPLRGAVDTPFFSADGALVTDNGYHAGSEMYLDCDLELARVSGNPTAEEAQEAARFIVEECLSDFPLGGLTREEVMAQVFTPDGVPAVANSLAFILLHFARDMIHGPTPGHIVNKPAPGTGAGFLIEVCTTIHSGVPAPALPMPKNSEEFSKTLTATLLDGESAVFFDNINHEMDSAELAAAMTAPETGYKARILGTTQTVLVPIRSLWVFAANTLTMSPELLRRCILIDLDRKAVDPAKYVPEDGWRHRDVREWTRNNRSKLVHACLTIIQHWVSQGMQRSGDTLASFENWAGIMGGILKACGIGGFMGNQSELSGLSDGRDDELASVVQAIAKTMHGKAGARLYVGSKTEKETAEGKFGLFDIMHAMDETPRLDHWGYSEERTNGTVEVVYSNGRKAGKRFKSAARRVYRVVLGGAAYVARFEQELDPIANVNCYGLELTPA